MKMKQLTAISGNVTDVYKPTDQRVRENRAPQVGDLCRYEDGREYRCVKVATAITAGGAVQAVPQMFVATAADGDYILKVSNSNAAKMTIGDRVLVSGKPVTITDIYVSGAVTAIRFDQKVSYTATFTRIVTPIDWETVAPCGSHSNVVGVAIVGALAGDICWIQTAGLTFVGCTADITACDEGVVVNDAGAIIIDAGAGLHRLGNVLVGWAKGSSSVYPGYINLTL